MFVNHSPYDLLYEIEMLVLDTLYLVQNVDALGLKNKHIEAQL